MPTLNYLKLINDTLINYYSDSQNKDEKKILKHNIIKEVLNIERCFEKITKEEAIGILKDLGISKDKLENVYQEVLQSQM